MDRFANELVRDVGAVEVAGVDVVDTVRDGLSQHGERSVAIFGRSEHAWTGELHRAVPDAIHTMVSERKRSGLADIDHVASVGVVETVTGSAATP
jgi:hypothetical protein